MKMAVSSDLNKTALQTSNPDQSNPVQTRNLFTNAQVASSRVIYTASSFARTSLLYLQECGRLTAIKPHVSSRSNLSSYLFFVVLDGSGWLEYDGQHYELTKGSAVFINCRQGYRQSSSDDLWSISWAHFNSASMPAVYNKYTERGGKPVFRLADKPDGTSGAEPFISILDKLYETASSNDFLKDMHISELLVRLTTMLMEETVYDESEQHEITTGVNICERIDVGAIKTYIDQNYKEPLSLETLADHFHFNKNYVSRSFKETFGVTVNGYVQLVRVGKVKEMLRFSSMSIEQISYECGFNGQASYLSRVFKKVEGCSPSDFRRNWMSINGGEREEG